MYWSSGRYSQILSSKINKKSQDITDLVDFMPPTETKFINKTLQNGQTYYVSVHSWTMVKFQRFSSLKLEIINLFQERGRQNIF